MSCRGVGLYLEISVKGLSRGGHASGLDVAFGSISLWSECPPCLPQILHLSSVILTSSRLVGDPLRSPPLLLCVQALGKCKSPGPQALGLPGSPRLPCCWAALRWATCVGRGSLCPVATSFGPVLSALFINDLAAIFGNALISFGHVGRME